MFRSAKVEKLKELVDRLREIHDEFPPQMLGIFLIVALEEGLTLTQIGEKIGLTIAAVSRNIGKLSDSHNGVKGFGLVSVDFAPGDYSRKSVVVTPKGVKFLQSLTDTIS